MTDTGNSLTEEQMDSFNAITVQILNPMNKQGKFLAKETTGLKEKQEQFIVSILNGGNGGEEFVTLTLPQAIILAALGVDESEVYSKEITQKDVANALQVLRREGVSFAGADGLPFVGMKVGETTVQAIQAPAVLLRLAQLSDLTALNKLPTISLGEIKPHDSWGGDVGRPAPTPAGVIRSAKSPGK